MKIAMWHNLPSGGGFRALHDQVRGLVARGNHVEVWCPESAERAFLPLDSATSVHRHPLGCCPKGYCRGRLGDAFSYVRNVRRQTWALTRHVQQCAQEIDAGRFDVLLAHPSQLFYMHPLARFTSTPSVLYLQEVYRPLYEARPKLPWEAYPSRQSAPRGSKYWIELVADMVRVQGDRFLLREERKAACEWDAILCNSRFSRESIIRTYGIDARMCYLGIDVETFSPGKGPRTHFVGLGSMDWAKGARLAIQAIGLLPPSLKRPLRWVGNAVHKSYLDECRVLAAERGVDFTCEIRLGEEELRDRLQSAVALIYPSVLEPFGYAPLEANACGTPVIAIAEGGIRESVQDGVNGLLVEDRRPESLSAGIRRLMTDTQLAEKLQVQAVEWVRERWNLEDSLARLEKELLTVVQAGRRTSRQPSLYDVT